MNQKLPESWQPVLRHAGSIKRIAEIMGVHRNTVRLVANGKINKPGGKAVSYLRGYCMLNDVECPL